MNEANGFVGLSNFCLAFVGTREWQRIAVVEVCIGDSFALVSESSRERRIVCLACLWVQSSA